MKNFKYKTRCFAPAKIIVPAEKDKFAAKASLESLKDVIKTDASQIKENPDLTYIAGDLFVAGMANKNGHGANLQLSRSIAKNFINKYINIEHEEDKIVGALNSYGFREYGNDNKLLTEEDLGEFANPFLVSVGGFIWNLINPKLAKILEESNDENSEYYNIASLSWEIYYNDYEITLGNRFYSESEVVNDPKEKLEASKHLKMNGGKGVYKDKEVNMFVIGEVTAAGCGIVKNPAADVKGIKTLTDINLDSKGSIIVPELETNDIEEEQESEKMAASEKEISQKEKNNVKKGKIKIMKTKADLIKHLESLANEEGADKNTILLAGKADDIIQEEIQKGAEEYKSQIEAKEKEKADAEAKASQFEEELKQVKASKEEIEKQLKEVQEKIEAQEKQTRYNERMSALDEEYDLDEETRKIISSQIKDLDDEKFEDWQNNFKVLAKEKSKEYKKKMAEEMKKEKEADDKKKKDQQDESKASEDEEKKKEEAAARAAASVEQNSDSPSSSVQEELSMEEKFKNSSFELDK